ncbi:helix-turn-helix domain-containing protein [Shewanella sp. 3B26]|jgi:transcriptional regulator with XRE-family HTH domain|uniref:Helix-turn-helix domain-containing protein n=1 Tax=Shewanella zhuhaiensis TaxID=2919576 RepID=A0AAJ1F1Q1_9GAMM|nr:helix-turn-helix domain-containing protein [Shewanella zhuhaiensis]MCH4295803.1 helix-turn-helix domain-containing protein [Shewanella zhuhaiensis]
MQVDAKKIRTERGSRGWTQQHLADACGVSLRTIQRVERYGQASQETLLALAATLNLNAASLVQPEPELVRLTEPETDQPEHRWRWLLQGAGAGFVAGILVMFLTR